MPDIAAQLEALPTEATEVPTISGPGYIQVLVAQLILAQAASILKGAAGNSPQWAAGQSLVAQAKTFLG